MNKIYYIASCDTCRKIIKSLPKGHNLVFRDIKQDPLTLEELEEMHQLTGSYESLFSKKAQLYKHKRGTADWSAGFVGRLGRQELLSYTLTLGLHATGGLLTSSSTTSPGWNSDNRTVFSATFPCLMRWAPRELNYSWTNTVPNPGTGLRSVTYKGQKTACDICLFLNSLTDDCLKHK